MRNLGEEFGECAIMADRLISPTTVRSVREGLLIGFDSLLEEARARNLANYHVGRWSYRRTKNYGSGHYKLNGKPRTEVVGASGIVLSSNHRSVLVV
ncbi:MAG: hypothetical protein M2R45_01899 [Verrucomicrobia subdivision 3 bacterium]|nr:hypothetical protein [Limisphaerales bacterium]MCS1415697.1 hypothetical protein [Limisphaerales bacterium]